MEPQMIDQSDAAAKVQRATLAQVKEQIAFAKALDRGRRGTKHRPGETKQAVAKRSAASRKRARGAAKSRRKNR